MDMRLRSASQHPRMCFPVKCRNAAAPGSLRRRERGSHHGSISALDLFVVQAQAEGRRPAAHQSSRFAALAVIAAGRRRRSSSSGAAGRLQQFHHERAAALPPRAPRRPRADSGTDSTSGPPTDRIDHVIDGGPSTIKMTVAPVDGTKPSDFDMTTHLYRRRRPASRATIAPTPSTSAPARTTPTWRASSPSGATTTAKAPATARPMSRRPSCEVAVERAHRRHRQDQRHGLAGPAAAGPASPSSSSGRTTSSRS